MNKITIFSIISLLTNQIFCYNVLNCTSIFNRSANGDGTNTYYFDCICKASTHDNKAKSICRIEGTDIRSQCSVSSKDLEKGLSVQILNCTGNDVVVKVGNHGLFTKLELPLKDCWYQGTAGRACTTQKEF